MTNYNIKAKNADGKFVTLGNIKPGKNGGWQVGIKATDAVADVINSLMVRDGLWVNISLFEDDGQRTGGQPYSGSPGSDSDVPF